MQIYDLALVRFGFIVFTQLIVIAWYKEERIKMQNERMC